MVDQEKQMDALVLTNDHSLESIHHTPDNTVHRGDGNFQLVHSKTSLPLQPLHPLLVPSNQDPGSLHKTTLQEQIQVQENKYRQPKTADAPREQDQI